MGRLLVVQLVTVLVLVLQQPPSALDLGAMSSHLVVPDAA